MRERERKRATRREMRRIERGRMEDREKGHIYVNNKESTRNRYMHITIINHNTEINGLYSREKCQKIDIFMHLQIDWQYYDYMFYNRILIISTPSEYP